MIHSENATKLIASFEGYRDRAYQDQGGIWTIGYGHTKGVKEGDTCDESAAMTMLDADILVVDKAIARLCPVPLSQDEYDALTSLIFNIGIGNFAHSTVLNELIRGDYQKAADAILLWDKVHGVDNPGLLRRRQAERLLFLKP